MGALTQHGAIDQLCHGISTTLNHSQTIAPGYDRYLEQFEAELALPQHFVFSNVLDPGEADPVIRREELSEVLAAVTAAGPESSCLGVSLHGVGIHVYDAGIPEEAALAT